MDSENGGQSSSDLQRQTAAVIARKKVLAAYLSGESYRDIARELEASPKSVDNALQRIKKKLERPLGVNK